MNKLIKPWLVPMIASLALFVVVRPTFAQIAERQANLVQYLSANDVEVDSEVVNGYHQVYYVFEGEKTYITEGNLNATSPASAGEYVVYRRNTGAGGDNTFLYHIPTAITIQLSGSSNNANPKVSGGKVVWEGWVIPSEGEPGWQVFFFDGKSVKQLTSGDLSMHPDIDGDFISYGRRDVLSWRSVVYSISKKEAKEVAIGISSKRPKVRNGRIILAGTGVEEVFPLTVDDLFLLDLGPLSTSPTPSPSPTPETVIEEEIAEELEATPSAAIEEADESAILASPTPEPTPEATSSRGIE